MPRLDPLLTEAGRLTRARFGKAITCYLPGMFVANASRGRYPAVSLTGRDCALHCDHCGGRLLEGMVPAATPAQLLAEGLRLEEAGALGVLLSGGCDSGGRLPWNDFVETVALLKEQTTLRISVHTGFIDRRRAVALKEAGVDQALIDLIGADATYERIYHLRSGRRRLEQSLEAICAAGLALVPHIVCGLHYGEFVGENEALALAARFPLDRLVFVSLMPIPGTATFGCRVAAEEVAALIARARIALPDTPISLGCARRRGDRLLERLALRAGITGLALPSDEVLADAAALGLSITYQKTCCSVAPDFPTSTWN